ncbi:hypothetical protein SAMN02799624_06637 [Paenibacillus sp. UNC496MF]|uniref:hypothetical protein n=1 Tax=Paenibacillus sp. UNC496MF TaxID=1502753 RepID=UPI0008EFD67D|nr:hypothetical protein [Paenibacillus sp. UNC496MF]SFJ93066.1 hypothetical protein SAMN02799624_06637 [Paenibacillus sp. UNC496MF]
MKNELTFNIPFSGFDSVTFINCFASTYMFLENIEAVRERSVALQESYFFLFDTMCGCSSLRSRFDGQPTEMQKMIGETDFYGCGTENNVEFLFGFAGYEYHRLTDPAMFKDEIFASIDAGKPVITKVKTGGSRFRVITGYDGDALICPDFAHAQVKPQGALSYDELDILYLIGDKSEPRYTLIDGLKRIRQVMEYNINENLWASYIEKMGLYTSDSLANADLEEKKARMKRVADAMWHTFNCHNFAEVFRKYRDGGDAAVYDMIGDMKKLHEPGLKELWDKISHCCGYTHDLAWALIGLEECADWSKHAAGYFGEMVELTLFRIAKNDVDAFDAIKQAIERLSE